MSIRFECNEYINVHGRAPRGRGYWAFALRSGGRWQDPTFVPGDLTLTEAKRAFVATLAPEQRAGIVYANVCP